MLRATSRLTAHLGKLPHGQFYGGVQAVNALPPAAAAAAQFSTAGATRSATTKPEIGAGIGEEKLRTGERSQVRNEERAFGK